MRWTQYLNTTEQELAIPSEGLFIQRQYLQNPPYNDVYWVDMNTNSGSYVQDEWTFDQSEGSTNRFFVTASRDLRPYYPLFLNAYGATLVDVTADGEDYIYEFYVSSSMILGGLDISNPEGTHLEEIIGMTFSAIQREGYLKRTFAPLNLQYGWIPF